MTMLDTAQFTGTEQWHRHGLVRSVTYTDGARYVAETAGAYWLLDKIATVGTMDPAVRKEGFQVWRLAVKGDSATLIAEDGDDNVIYSEEISYTDFPAPGVTLWMCDSVILLPSEY